MCIRDSTRDNNREANSRWSCQGDGLDSSDDDEGCWIDYYFDEPQDIIRVRIAFHQGTSRTRTLDVYDNGDFHSTITSSGTTNGYQNFLLNTDETYNIRLRLNNFSSNSDVWLSLTEVRPVFSRALCVDTFCVLIRFVNVRTKCHQEETRLTLAFEYYIT